MRLQSRHALHHQLLVSFKLLDNWTILYVISALRSCGFPKEDWESPSTSAAHVPSGTRTHPRIRPRMTWHALTVPTCAPSSTARFVQALRQLDDSVRHQRIAVIRIPQRGLGVTINERRIRAVRNAHAPESQTSHDLACACSPDMRSIINCSFRSSSSTTGRFCTSSAHCGHADSPKRIGSHHQRAPHTCRPERARIREPDLA